MCHVQGESPTASITTPAAACLVTASAGGPFVAVAHPAVVLAPCWRRPLGRRLRARCCRRVCGRRSASGYLSSLQSCLRAVCAGGRLVSVCSLVVRRHMYAAASPRIASTARAVAAARREVSLHVERARNRGSERGACACMPQQRLAQNRMLVRSVLRAEACQRAMYKAADQATCAAVNTGGSRRASGQRIARVD